MIERLTSWFTSDHKHEWTEKREVAIRLTCECGAIEWTQNRPGRVKRAQSVAAQGTPKQIAKAARDEEWRRLYEVEGLTLKEVSQRTHAPMATVWSALHRMGVSRKHRAQSPKGAADAVRAAEIVRLRTVEHLTLLEIGQRFGFSRERARQILAREGVDMKNAAHEYSLATAKKYQRRSKCCKVCGEDYGWGNWKAHYAATRHAPQRKDEQDAALAADYAAGMLQREIMAKHGVAATAVMRAVKRLGIPKRRPQTARMPEMAASKRRKERIVAEYAAGGSPADIAARHHVSISWVYYAARQSGIRRRAPNQKVS